MKRALPILVVILLILAAAGVYAFTRLRQTAPVEDTTTNTPRVQEKYNEIPVTERPYLHIAPTTESGKRAGSSLDLTLYELKKAAQTGEYELEYQSGTLLQGAFGRFKLSTFPEETTIFLGSCSAGGKCSYHEEVTGGSIILRFTNGEKYSLKNEWSYIENTDQETTWSSRDAKFSLSGEGLSRISHAVILQSPGLPENPQAELLSAPYAVGVLQSARGSVKVSIRLNQETAQATILGWDGKAWQELDTTVADKVATATSPLYQAYVVVSQ